MYRIFHYFIFIWIHLVLVPGLLAQDAEKIKFSGSIQLWMRYTDLNPGSSIGNQEFNDAFDISLRRYRLGLQGQFNERISYNFTLGNNNLSRYQIDQSPKVLDAYVNYRFSDQLIITGGKHAWTGTSRYAAPSTLSALGSDINFSATPALNVHDDLLRKLSIAVRGQLDKLDYRIAFAKPFVFVSQPLSEEAVFVDNPTSLNISGYFKYQFLDKESLSSAFSPWTYLGNKEIFNMGAGWTFQSKATQSLSSGDTLDHAMRSFGIDIFYDKPIGKSAWTFYAVYLIHDLGPGFVRYIGANNPASGTVKELTLNGRGNSFPEAGTGQILFGNIGYLRKFENFGLQPYTMIELADFEALDDPMFLLEAGINYLLDGHQSKVTLGYRNRPVFIAQSGQRIVDNRKSMVVLQYQVRF
ncbi:MAG: porin [Cyclobacteriaceae bacterium]|tara:strand:+ start:5010 stop:6245 length:1236 start_codon:yes stop_codon:yes gene_type:complete